MLCISLFLKSAGGQFTDVVQGLDTADLSCSQNGLSRFRVNVGSAGLFIDHPTCLGVNNAASLTLRHINSLLPTGQQSGGTAPLFSVFIGIPLVTLTKLGDAVVFFGLPVVQLVFGRIDDHHAVFNSPGNLTFRGTLEGHVRDEV